MAYPSYSPEYFRSAFSLPPPEGATFPLPGLTRLTSLTRLTRFSTGGSAAHLVSEVSEMLPYCFLRLSHCRTWHMVSSTDAHPRVEFDFVEDFRVLVESPEANRRPGNMESRVCYAGELARALKASCLNKLFLLFSKRRR